MYSRTFDETYAKELAEFDEFVKTKVASKICYRFDIHSLYLTHEGHVYTRGLNSDGQLGLGDRNNRYRKDGHIMPVKVPDLENISSIYSGSHESFCIDKNFRVYAWGKNGSGQLGLGHNEDVLSPCQITALEDHKIIDVQTNACVTYFLDEEGCVYSCGYFNSSASTGLGEWINNYPDKNPVNTPMKIQGLPSIKNIVPLGDHVFFLTAEGEVYGCGSNYDGVLGVGDNNSRYTPVKLDLPPIVQICGSWDASFFLTQDGKVFACGKNELKQISMCMEKQDDLPENFYHLVHLNLINEPIVKMELGSCNIFLTNRENVYIHFHTNPNSNRSEDTNSELKDFRATNIPIPKEILNDRDNSGYWLHTTSLYKFGAGSETALLCHKKLNVPLSLKLLSTLSFMANRNQPNNTGIMPDDISEYINEAEKSQSYDAGLRH